MSVYATTSTILFQHVVQSRASVIFECAEDSDACFDCWRQKEAYDKQQIHRPMKVDIVLDGHLAILSELSQEQLHPL